MKVALISLHFAEYASRLALSLQKEHDVHLFLSRVNAAKELTAEVRDAINVCAPEFCYHPRRMTQPLQAASLAAKLMALRPDVIHVQETLAYSPAWALRALPRVWPVVLTVHDPTPHPGRDSQVAQRYQSCIEWLRARANRIIVHGETLAQQWRERDRANGARVSAVAHGTLGGMTPWSEQVDEPITFLFFGRIEEYKGLDVLTHATEMLSARTNEFKLIVAGAGDDLKRYRKRLLDLDQVELIERYILPTELPMLFQRSAVIVLPYKEASQSGVAAMSFAAGRPVISTAVGALPDIVTHNNNGILIPPSDPRALCAAMEKMIRSVDLYKQLRLGAIKTATGPLSWSSIAQATSAVYLDAIRHRFGEKA